MNARLGMFLVPQAQSEGSTHMGHRGDGSSEHVSVRGTQRQGEARDDGHRDQRMLTLPRRGPQGGWGRLQEHPLRSRRVACMSILWEEAEGGVVI